jgi:hypothetical protein
VRLVFHYFLARYLDLHGKPQQAVECWKKCMAETEFMGDFHRTLAGAELCAHDVLPESYRALIQPEAAGEKKKLDEM